MGIECLVYVNDMGIDSENKFVYEFYLVNVEDKKNFWIDSAEIRPAGICLLGVPDKSNYDAIKILRTDIKFDLAKKSSSHSFLDCIDGVLALVYENIDLYESYPENGRLVFKFGELMSTVEIELAKRDLAFED